MRKRLVLITLAMSVMSANVFPTIANFARKQRILQATVTMTVIVPDLKERPATADEALPIPRDEYQPIVRPSSYTVSEGLGTLVTVDDETLIVTHDHWSLLDRDLGSVQFRNANGQPLLEISLLKFKKLINYRDGGTMLVRAPQGLSTHSASGLFQLSVLGLAQPGHGERAAAGDTVLVTRRDPASEGAVEIIEAVVELTGVKQGQETLRLRSENGAIISGDSGGGVWLDGRLVGNTWTAVMMEDTGTGTRRATDTSIAALYPPAAVSSVAS